MSFLLVRLLFNILVPALWARHNSDALPSGTLKRLENHIFHFEAYGEYAPLLFVRELVHHLLKVSLLSSENS